MVYSSYQLVYTQKIHREPENTPLLQRKIIWTKRSFSGSMLNSRGDRGISRPSLVINGPKIHGLITGVITPYKWSKNKWITGVITPTNGSMVTKTRSRVGGRESQSLSFPTVGAPPGDLGKLTVDGVQLGQIAWAKLGVLPGGTPTQPFGCFLK